MLPYTEIGALHKDGSKEWGDILALPNNLSLENLAAAQTLSPIIKILEKKVNSNYQSEITFCKQHVAYFVY